MRVAVSQHENFVGGEWDHTQIKHVLAKIDRRQCMRVLIRNPTPRKMRSIFRMKHVMAKID